MKVLSGILVVLLFTGCASTKQNVPVASMETLKEGNALIRVERQNGFVGGGRSVEITENGVVVGQVSPGNSIIWERPSGEVAINLAPATLAVSELPPINISMVAGKAYDFLVSWSWGKNSFIIEQK